MENKQMLDNFTAGSDGIAVRSGSEEALINKVAQEMAVRDRDSLNERTPDSIASRYGLAAARGLYYLPRGIGNAVTYDVEHPWQTLGTLGMGVATGAALKYLLPECGSTGRIATAAIGTYFAWQAAKPVLAGFKEAGQAANIRDLDLAAMKIADAGGATIVNTLIAGTGARLGAAGVESLLSARAAARVYEVNSLTEVGLSKTFIEQNGPVGTFKMQVGNGKEIAVAYETIEHYTQANPVTKLDASTAKTVPPSDYNLNTVTELGLSSDFIKQNGAAGTARIVDGSGQSHVFGYETAAVPEAAGLSSSKH
jgi:hypothetical protein